MQGRCVHFIAFVCFFVLAFCIFTIEIQAQVPEEYSRVAENERFSLYLNPESLSVTIVETYSGRMLRSVATVLDGINPLWSGFMRSGFGVEFFNDTAPTAQRLNAFNGNPAIDLRYVYDGFDADIFFETQEIGFQLQVRLTKDGMTAFVPGESIQEPDNMRIGSIFLYPLMGATLPHEAEGYMFIPEGAGALIDLADNNGRFRMPYAKRIFGQNVGIDSLWLGGGGWINPQRRPSMTVLMPVYGIAHTCNQLAFLAIAEKGAFNAEVMAYPNGVTTPYNWAAIRFILREQFSMQINRTSSLLTSERIAYVRDLKIRFIILTGDDADYNGMAAAYRQFLSERGYLPSHDVSFRTRIDFLGAESTSGLIRNRTLPMTTVSQMESMLTGLTDNGAGDILAIYRGWQNGGLTRNHGSGNFNLDRSLGRIRDLERLEENLPNVQLTLYQNFLLANTSRRYNTNTNIVKGINQMLVHVPTNSWPYSSMFYFTPRRITQLVSQFSRRTVASFNLALGSIGNTLFSYYSRDGVTSRGGTQAAIVAAIEPLLYENAGFALETPFTYMLPYTSAFLDMPMSTSGYSFIMAEVPFLPMVLSGHVPMFTEHVNFVANTTEFFLKMVEYGTFPSFILTYEEPVRLRRTNSSWVYVSGIDIFEPRILRYSNELGYLHNRIDGSAMERHVILAPGVNMVIYENGLQIIINYNRESFTTADGIEIDAESFWVG